MPRATSTVETGRQSVGAPTCPFAASSPMKANDYAAKWMVPPKSAFRLPDQRGV